jgi:hypothetical protein
VGESAKAASTSGMRNKPYRKGDRLIESLASGVVVFDLNEFIVSFSVYKGKPRIGRKRLID